MTNIYKEPQDPTFTKVGIEGRIFDSKGIAPSAEFFTVNTTLGHETTIRQRDSDFFYYVLSGAGTFTISEQVQQCNVGNLIVIPKGTWFRYDGSMKLLAASVPPWREEQEETREG